MKEIFLSNQKIKDICITDTTLIDVVYNRFNLHSTTLFIANMIKKTIQNILLFEVYKWCIWIQFQCTPNRILDYYTRNLPSVPSMALMNPFSIRSPSIPNSYKMYIFLVLFAIVRNPLISFLCSNFFRILTTTCYTYSIRKKQWNTWWQPVCNLICLDQIPALPAFLINW